MFYLKKKKGKQTYLAKSLDLFLNSKKIGFKKLSYIVFVDAIFYGIIISTLFYLYSYLLEKAKDLSLYDPKQILDSKNTVMMELVSAKINVFVSTIKIALFSWLGFFTILFSISAYLIWMRISEKKKSFFGFFKFLAFNLTFFAIFFAGVFTSVKNISEHQLAFSILLFSFMLIMTTAYAIYSRHNNLLDTLKGLFAVAKKAYLLLIPLAAIFLVNFIASYLIYFIEKIIHLESQLAIWIVFASYVLIFSAWARNYYYSIIEDIIK